MAPARLASVKANQIVVGAAINLLGMGLTAFLFRTFYVSTGLGVEIAQPIAIPFLSDLPAMYPDRLALLWGDALSIDYTGLVPPPTKVVANIPYNITTPLVWRLLEQLPGGGADYFLLMVQREAAERIIAPPHTKERYPLGVTVELMGSASIVRHVSPGSFRPSPAVSSALLEIRLSGQNRDLPNDPLWRSMLRTGFAMRRKMLINNLRLHYPSVEWNELFQRAGVGEKARADLELRLAALSTAKRAEFERIIAANPDAKNPIDRRGGSYTCLYKQGDHYCLVGQLAHEQGWTLSADYFGPADGAADLFGWPVIDTAKQYLIHVQMLADGVEGPIPWGAIDLDEAGL